MRATALIAATLLLAACSAPDHEGGEAAPAGSVPAATSAAPTSSAPSSAAPSATSPSPSPVDQNVLGPFGFRTVKLGMSRKQALATGLVTGTATNECGTLTLLKLPSAVTFRSDRGVVAIVAPDKSVHTPEGVGYGTTRDRLKEIYPDFTFADGGTIYELDGRGYAKVRGNAKAVYRITTSEGKVDSLTLQSVDQGCYE
jgi:hypothetical protein